MQATRNVICGAISGAFFTLSCFTGAQAVVINFEDQPAGQSTFIAAGNAKTLNYNLGGGLTAQFTGGVILTNETSQTTDNSNVYATCRLPGCSGITGYTNPLVVTFSQPIHNFQMDILNAIAGNYEVLDNAGHSSFFTLATTGGSLQTVGFAATGSVVNILFLGDPSHNDPFGIGNWDFAIDNLAFNQDTVGGDNGGGATPLPAALPLFATGLGGLGLLGWRRKKKAAPAA